MTAIEKRLTLKQACGFALTIHDFYDVLVEFGLLAKNPEAFDFAQRKEMLDLIVYSEEIDLSAEPALQQLQRQMQRQKHWRMVALALVVPIIGFGALLSHQLSRREVPQPAQLMESQQPAPPPGRRLEPPPPPSPPQVREATPVQRPDSPNRKSVPAEEGRAEPVVVETSPVPHPPESRPVAPEPPPRARGCLQGNCRNGEGTFLFADGSRYTGGWRDGRMHGDGAMSLPSGRGYQGQWKQGKLIVIDNTRPQRPSLQPDNRPQ
ncbi:MAG: hypothetical protein HQM02_08425 [Magnetococcales bacterium]|nr:hypothetical protein [Magnetococcales bacterium]